MRGRAWKGVLGLKNINFEICYFRLTRCVGGHGRGPWGLKMEISKFGFIDSRGAWEGMLGVLGAQKWKFLKVAFSAN